MKSVGCAERSLRQAQEEVLRTAVHVASQLDAPVHTAVEASDHGVQHTPRDLPPQGALAQTT